MTVTVTEQNNQVIVSTTGSQGPAGGVGPAGTSILNGSSAPQSSDGNNGDFFLETTNSRLYGPKAAGAWPSSYVSLIGPTGSTGSTGSAGSDGSDGQDGKTLLNGSGAPSGGNDGDFWIDTTNNRIYGPKASGSWPSSFTSIVGPQGQVGQTGSTGASGAAATIAVGSVSTGAAGSSATVSNSGSSSAATFDFSIPKGDKGDTGDVGSTGPQGQVGATGSAATIAVGSTSTGNPGTNASVTNSGSSSAATFDFTIPRGDTGASGSDGKTVLNGSGAPGSGLGVDGDFYIDTTNNAIYGPKASGAWGSGTSYLQGPAGQDGQDGQDGQGITDGDKGDVVVSNTGTVWTIDNDAITNAKILDDTIAESKLDIHAAPSGTNQFLGYTANGMEWAVPPDTNTTYSIQDGELSKNNFTDALKTKLDSVESNSTADMTGAEIKTAYEAESNTNAFTDSEKTKLAAIEASATADMTGSEIKSAYEGESNTNAFTDTEKTKLSGIAASANNYAISADLLDEDNMSTNSATKVPSQQSVKAYVDANSSDTTYTAGTGLQLSGTQFSVTSLAITTVQEAANESSQLGLTTQEGDIVVRTDENKSYVRNSNSSGNMSDFTLLRTPTDAVLSVNGNTGAITSNQLAAAIESATDSNTFTDADHSKLNAIEANATADMTGGEIKTAYEAESDTNAYTDAEKSKLAAIEASATGDQTNAEIRAAVEAATDSNVFTDADHNKLDGISASANNYSISSDLLDEDNMASDSSTKVASQQSIKAYVDAHTGATNLSYTASSRELASSTGTNVTLPEVTTSNAGLQSSSDKSKLDGIASGAEVNVNGDWNSNSGDSEILNKPTIPTNNNQLTNGSNYVTSSIISSLDAGNLSSGKVPIGRLGSSGTASSSTYLRGDNSWQTISTGLPSGGTFTADVTFTGDNYNLVWDKSDNALELAQQAKLKVGDFDIWANSYGNLMLEDLDTSHSTGIYLKRKDKIECHTDDFKLESQTYGDMLRIYNNKAEFKCSNTKRLEVNTSGATVTGTCTATSGFSGSGASLTNLPAAQITGTLPAISGANLTNVNATTLGSVNSSNFARKDTSQSISGVWSHSGQSIFEYGSSYAIKVNSSGDQKIQLKGSTNPQITFQSGSSDKGYVYYTASDTSMRIKNANDNSVLRVKDDLDFSDDGYTFNSVIHGGNVGSGGKLSNKNVYVNQIHGNGSNLTNLDAANITSGGTLPALNGSNLTNLPASGGTVDLYAHTSNIAAGKPVFVNSSGKVEEVASQLIAITPAADTTNAQYWNTSSTNYNTSYGLASAICTISGTTYIVNVFNNQSSSSYAFYVVGRFDTSSPYKTITWGTPTAFGSNGMYQHPEIAAMGNTGRFVLVEVAGGNGNEFKFHAMTLNTSSLSLTRANPTAGTALVGTNYSRSNYAKTIDMEPKNDNYCFFSAHTNNTFGYIWQIKWDGSNFSAYGHNQLYSIYVGTDTKLAMSYSNPGGSSGKVLLTWNNHAQQVAVVMVAPPDNMSFSGQSSGGQFQISTKLSSYTYTGGWISSTSCFVQGVQYQYSWVQQRPYSLMLYTTNGSTTISSGAETQIEGNNDEVYRNTNMCFWDSNTNRLIFQYNLVQGTNSGKIFTRTGTVSGNSVTLSNAVEQTRPAAVSAIGSTSLVKLARKVFQHPDDASMYIQSCHIGGGSTDRGWIQYLSTSEPSHTGGSFVGITSAAINANAEGTINVSGSVNDQVSGLTAGSVYYLGSTGGLSTVAAEPTVKVGVALSSTKLLVGA